MKKNLCGNEKQNEKVYLLINTRLIKYENAKLAAQDIWDLE
jgi:hypothetical protein